MQATHIRLLTFFCYLSAETGSSLQPTNLYSAFASTRVLVGKARHIFIYSTQLRMELLAVLVTAFVATFVAVVFLRRRRNGSDGGKKVLPPGSMGLPFIGETLQYLTPFQSSNGGPFLRNRLNKYGETFKTHLFGKPTVVTASSEANQFVFQNEGKLFRASYPEAFVNLLGENNITQIHGPMHKKLRQLGLSFVGFENLKSSLLPQVESQVIQTLSLWKDGSTVQVKEEAEKITFNMLMKQLVSMDPDSSESKELLKSYSDFMIGLFALPIKLPGTTYSRCCKGRERVLSALKSIISERRKENRQHSQDFLDSVLKRIQEDDEDFSDELLLDFIFGFLFAAYDTTSIAMTMAVKYLSQSSSALQKLREEHEEIMEEKNRRNETNLSWEDYKSMTFTRNVIKETLRLSNIGPYLYRECMEDTQIKGYHIPKGWKVVICTSAAHLDSSVFSEPFTFNPWRWEKELNEASFQGFGGGARYCVGSELAKLEISVFLHYLVTQYNWERKEDEKGEVIRCPVLLFEKGYPVTVYKRHV